MVKFLLPGLFLLLTAGCNSSALPDQASAQNSDISGWVMLAKAETVNSATASPAGKIIIGRVSYKSRQVAIPADQKVPNTGSFRCVATESILGTRETIIEYDYTAESAEQAQAAEAMLTKKITAPVNHITGSK